MAEAEADVAALLAELHLAKETLRQQEETLRLQSFCYGLPPLADTRTVSSSDTRQRARKGHQDADVKKKTFPLMEFDLDCQSFLRYRWFVNGKVPLEWSREIEITTYVSLALEDACRAANVQLKVVPDLEVLNLRPDLWMMMSASQMPVAVVEVKPADHEVACSSVHGQLFDYLELLRGIHGIRVCLGIATNYNKWQVCWLDPQGDGVAESYLAATNETDLNACRTQQGEEGEVEMPQKPEGRTMCASELYDWDNPLLPQVLATVCRKAAAASNTGSMAPPLNASSEFSNQRPYIKCSQKDSAWSLEKLPPNLQGKTPKMYGKETQRGKPSTTVFLHSPFYTASHHRVWTAFDASGFVFILKFFPSEDEDFAKEERDCWNTLWGDTFGKAASFPLKGEHALKLPLIPRILRDSDVPQLSEEEVERVRECVRYVAGEGVRHADLRWRHVGFGPGRNPQCPPEEAVLIDLGNVEICDVEEKEERAEWVASAVQRMLGDLSLNAE